jgi:quaternary ammonium compound-resistance protein SugE
LSGWSWQCSRWRSAARSYFWRKKRVALGTAYAVWTGIGAAGTFLVGIWVFGDASGLGRYLGVVLIIAGVVTLKLAH